MADPRNGPTRVGAATTVPLPRSVDGRGSLTAVEFGDTLPFAPRRVFVISGVPLGAERGEHANRDTHEVLICVAGEITVTVDQCDEPAQIVLAEPELALHIPPLVWVRLHDATSDAVVVVLASTHYDSHDAVRDRTEFARLLGVR